MRGNRRGTLFDDKLLVAFGDGEPGAVTRMDTGPGWSTLSGLVLGSATVGKAESVQWVAAAVSLYADWKPTEAYGWLAPYFEPGTAHIAVYSDVGETPGDELYSRQFSVPGPAMALPDWHGVTKLDWALPAGNYWVAFEVRPGDTFSGLMGKGVPAPVGNEAGWGDTSWFDDDLLDLGVGATGERQPPVREPGMMTLLGSGLIGLSFAAQGWRAASVDEVPAETWRRLQGSPAPEAAPRTLRLPRRRSVAVERVRAVEGVHAG